MSANVLYQFPLGSGAQKKPQMWYLKTWDRLGYSTGAITFLWLCCL